MKQRVAIARTLAADPQLILMDEPFGSLDSYMREKLQDLVTSIWKKLSKTIIFVTHNVREAVLLGNRTIILNEFGEIIYNKSTPVTTNRVDDSVIAMEKEIRLLISSTANFV